MPKIPICVISLTVVSGIKLPNINVRPGLMKNFNVIPLKIYTPGDDRITVDMITDIRREASLKAGGSGDKYTCHATLSDIQREIYVYKHEDDWYMESDFSDALILQTF